METRRLAFGQVAIGGVISKLTDRANRTWCQFVNPSPLRVCPLLLCTQPLLLNVGRSNSRRYVYCVVGQSQAFFMGTAWAAIPQTTKNCERRKFSQVRPTLPGCLHSLQQLHLSRQDIPLSSTNSSAAPRRWLECAFASECALDYCVCRCTVEGRARLKICATHCSVFQP